MTWDLGQLQAAEPSTGWATWGLSSSAVQHGVGGSSSMLVFSLSSRAPVVRMCLSGACPRWGWGQAGVRPAFTSPQWEVTK